MTEKVQPLKSRSELTKILLQQTVSLHGIMKEFDRMSAEMDAVLLSRDALSMDGESIDNFAKIRGHFGQIRTHMRALLKEERKG